MRGARRWWTARQLFGRFGLFQRQRLGAAPGMLGDVEEHTFGAVEFDLETAEPVAVLVHVMLAAQALELLGGFVDVLDQDAEMVQAGVIQALAELVGLEPQDRQVDRAVAQMMPISERPIVRADDLEVESLYIEIGHRVRILGGDGNVTKLGHRGSPLSIADYSAACFRSTGSGAQPAQGCSAMSKSTRSGP